MRDVALVITVGRVGFSSLSCHFYYFSPLISYRPTGADVAVREWVRTGWNAVPKPFFIETVEQGNFVKTIKIIKKNVKFLNL